MLISILLVTAWNAPLQLEIERASWELEALRKADQAVRQFKSPPTVEELERMSRGDLAREMRVRQLLAQDRVRTKEDLDAAALIFQHGQDPEDYEAARELSILSCFKGGVHSLPALAEDRFLSSIGLRQRFGSQFGHGGELRSEPDEKGKSRVTEALRTDFLVPPLAAVRAHGMMALGSVRDHVFKRVKQRWLDPKWQKEALKWHESRELETLFRRYAGKDFDPRIEEKVLRIYHRDRIGPPSSLYHAASLLIASSEAETVLLANELAALAAMRRYAPAKNLFARSWDRFLTILGRRDRYGTVSGARIVSPIVAREFGVVEIRSRSANVIPIEKSKGAMGKRKG